MQRLSAIATALVAVMNATVASADSTAGVDVALFRSSYDTNGVFTLEGARLMPKRDLSFKLSTGYAKSPLDVAVPGIGGMANTGDDSILDYVVLIDMAFAMSITDKLAIGFDVGAYRTATGTGYGARGRYTSGTITTPSTGLLSLRPLTNIDPSADPGDEAAYRGDGLSGPLDARAGIKYALYTDAAMALTLVGSIALPFGDDEMLLGDKNLVYEPKVAYEWRPDRVHQTRVVANLGARIRNRTVLEAYDTAPGSMETADDAKVFLDVGSELVVGAGGTYEVAPRIVAAAEVTLLAPLPESIGYGSCRRYNGRACSSIDSDDYWAGAKQGDLTVLAAAGAFLRLTADVTASVTVGTGQVGARGDDLRVTTGLVWAPQPAGVAAPGRNDHDGDGIPDAVDGCSDEAEDRDEFQDEDGCPDDDNDGDGIGDDDDDCALEPEDKDGFKDTDGCPERDNESDGVPDTTDKCPNDSEDIDGFEDDDGCPDEDNDGDGIKDAADKCPNDAETANGVEDDDGCPDVRATTGPEERADRIDLKGQPVAFDKQNKLTAAAKALLTQASTIIKNRKLTIRIEVHVALGTKSTNAAQIKAQKQRDKQTAQQRARAIQEFLVGVGVPPAQLQAVGIGSDRPLGTLAPTDPSNDRVDLIKAQQGGVP